VGLICEINERILKNGAQYNSNMKVTKAVIRENGAAETPDLPHWAICFSLIKRKEGQSIFYAATINTKGVYSIKNTNFLKFLYRMIYYSEYVIGPAGGGA
jgi:hypothetical protein